MPKLATAEFFRQRKLQPGEILAPPEQGGLKGIIPVAGLMPVLVPSMVDAGLLALRDYGTRSFADVITPAIELLTECRSMKCAPASIERGRRFFELWPSSKRVFMPGGRTPQAGESSASRTWPAPCGRLEAEHKALAAGQNRVAAIDVVRDYFYRGEIARKIDAFSRDNRGLIRYEDLGGVQAAAGGACFHHLSGIPGIQAGILVPGALHDRGAEYTRGLRPAGHEIQFRRVSAHVGGSDELAYADRDTYYGDPKFAQVPAARLLSKEYAAERRKLIGQMASLDFRPERSAIRPLCILLSRRSCA